MATDANTGVEVPLAELPEAVQTALKAAPAAEKHPAANPGAHLSGRSAAAQELYRMAKVVAPTDMSVLILGESGTGKEHIARTIHAQSNRATGPFVAIDCGCSPMSWP